jgi:hypothetical protein
MKKRFPRFSLRALVIAVLAIAVCWTLTATWGVSTVLEGKWSDMKTWERHREGNSLRLLLRQHAESAKIWEVRVHCTAIAPFLITSTVELSYDGQNFQQQTKATDFWFFGYFKTLPFGRPFTVF